MCGPGFCSMRITEDVRKLADEEGQPVDIEKAMQENKKTFEKVIYPDADHAFHVRAKSGSTDEAVLRALADAIAQWTATVAVARPRAI